jgi:hypothetical protein
MVEEAKIKFCENLHKNEIEFFCSRCDSFVCKECATNFHSDHFVKLHSIENYYRDSQSKIHLFKEMMGPHQFYKRIEVAYDNLVQKIIDYKETFINQVLKDIFRERGRIDEQPIQDLLNQLNQKHEKILGFLKSEEKKDEDLNSLVSPQNLNEQITELYEQGKTWLEKPKFCIEEQFTSEKLMNFFKIEIPTPPIVEALKNTELYIYHLETKEGKTFHNDQIQLRNASCIRSKDEIYIWTGTNNVFLSFNVFNETFTKRASTITSKNATALVDMHQTHIYSIGGYGATDSCEKYDILEGCWRSITHLNQKKYFVSACPVNHVFIFAFGGYTDKYVDMIEKLNTAEEGKGWSIVNLKLNKEGKWTPRYCPASIQIAENSILLFGGYNESGYFGESFIFNLQNETIEEQEFRSESAVFGKTFYSPFIYKDSVWAVSQTHNLTVYSITEKKGRIISKVDWI